MQLHKNLAYISLFFSIFCAFVNIILYGFTYHNDLIYYYHFIEYGYEFGRFTFIPVMYLPHFYFLFYPFSFIPIQIMYCVLSAIICYALYRMIFIIHELNGINNTTKYIIMFLVMIDSAIESSWCNMEIICLFVYMVIMQKVMRTGELSVFQTIILAVFSFKIVSILHFLYILIYSKNRLKVFLIYFGSIFLMCIPYLLIDGNILSLSYWIYIIENSNPTLTNQYIIQRNTLLVPLVLIISYYTNKIWSSNYVKNILSKR